MTDPSHKLHDLNDPGRYLLRPARSADLDALERLAAASAHGITTLPADRSVLQDRLARSTEAFTSADDASGSEIYLFVLEDTAAGWVVGTAGITAAAGEGGQFYCYRNEYTVQVSAALATSNRLHTLHLCHDLTGTTLLTSFYIEPAYEQTPAPQLLSRGRLLFIHQFAERFAERVAAESPGLADDAGHCPFWAAVGQRFIGMDYPTVEQLAVGRSKRFIAELLPQSPVYVALLPEQAQWAVGQLHPVAALPFSILQDEGFDTDTYVDVFDAGPIVETRLTGARSVALSRPVRVSHGGAAPAAAGRTALHIAASSQRAEFRAALCRLAHGEAELPASVGARLALAPGAPAIASPLAQVEETRHV